MPGYFSMAFNSVRAGHPGTIAFNLTVEQNNRRVARICSAELELWLVNPALGQNLSQFLAPLRPDIRGEVTDGGARFLVEFRNQQSSPCRVLWHYTPEQLQQVEDARGGGKACFHIYARFTVQADWATPRNESPNFTHEIETPGHVGGWPMIVEIAESDWIALLGDIRFRHPVMHRLPWPALPPRFSRAESHLDDAWNHYRRNEPAATLGSCYKAFECLGFDLFGKEVERKDVLDLLMQSAGQGKQEVILGVLRSLQNFFQLGRHDKGAPLGLSQNDAQMAVVCATTLMAYLVAHTPETKQLA